MHFLGLGVGHLQLKFQVLALLGLNHSGWVFSLVHCNDVAKLVLGLRLDLLDTFVQPLYALHVAVLVYQHRLLFVETLYLFIFLLYLLDFSVESTAFGFKLRLFMFLLLFVVVKIVEVVRVTVVLHHAFVHHFKFSMELVVQLYKCLHV